MDINDVFAEHKITSSEPLLKGWSKDKKHVLTSADGEKFLLHLSGAELFEKKKKQFELLKSIESLNISCSRPVNFGRLDDGRVFMILSYLDGVDGVEAVSRMNDEDAYTIGVEAGAVLRKIHGIPLPPQERSWWERYLEKMPRKIAALENCEYSIPMQDMMIRYYRDNCEIMKDRPLALCHGDYHLGNMIVRDKRIAVIDFDENGPADPYDDLKPFCWNVMVSEYFETGLINGYFDDRVPDKFWRILKFYTCESLISHLPWSIAFGEEELKTTRRVEELTMKWYDNFKLDVPNWYKGVK